MDKKVSKEGFAYIVNQEADASGNLENEADLVIRVHEAEAGVNNWVVDDINQLTFDVLVSLVSSIGVDSFKRSDLLKRINQGKFEQAADEFEKWVFKEGKKLPELIIRRGEERNLFLSSIISPTTPNL